MRVMRVVLRLRASPTMLGPEMTSDRHMDRRMDMAERLDELEIKLSFTEDTVDALNRVVAQQQARIDLLQDELRILFQQIRQNTAAEKGDLREEIPPHY